MIHIEVRKKIVEARKRGLKIEEICHAYGVGKTAVFRLLKQERETGDITPQTHMRGRKPALDEAGLHQLKALLDNRPDITLEEIKEEMELRISISALSKIIRGKLHYQYKKNGTRQRAGSPRCHSQAKRVERKAGRVGHKSTGISG